MALGSAGAMYGRRRRRRDGQPTTQAGGVGPPAGGGKFGSQGAHYNPGGSFGSAGGNYRPPSLPFNSVDQYGRPVGAQGQQLSRQQRREGVQALIGRHEGGWNQFHNQLYGKGYQGPGLRQLGQTIRANRQALLTGKLGDVEISPEMRAQILEQQTALKAQRDPLRDRRRKLLQRYLAGGSGSASASYS